MQRKQLEWHSSSVAAQVNYHVRFYIDFETCLGDNFTRQYRRPLPCRLNMDY